jgi:hypothetical protein
MTRGLLGMINTPAQGSKPVPAARTCYDNGKFGEGWPGYHKWARWLDRQPRTGCVFAVAPDTPFNAAATLRQFGPAGRFIRRLGFPVAFAAQDGIERLTVPWDALDVVFLGGSTAWKLGPHARRLTAQAHARGKWVHMGRVNSLRRLRYAAATGCDSADGTYLRSGPDENLPKLLGWLRDVNDQQVLFGMEAS